jgi:site-specific recombinase XerD
LFPTVHKTGAIGSTAMTGHAVNEMIRRRAEQAAFTPAQTALLAGHSLRAGFVTEAFRAGADAHSIMRQTVPS